MMKQAGDNYRVLATTALFGTVRVSKGDVVRRELLGVSVRKLIEAGVVEPVPTNSSSAKPVQASLI